MRKMFLISLIIIIFFVIIIPLCTLLFLDFRSEKNEVDIFETGRTINVFNHQTEKLITMNLEEYIKGVVAAEMPASFELEALKAQAVAARTYAYRRLIQPDERITKLSPNAHVVTDPNICQAWVSESDLKERWGYLDFFKYMKKINKAVAETKGEVLVHDGKLIDPVYHSSCGGGKTENSGEVWKYNFPYLRSVSCLEHKDKHFQDKKTIQFKNFDIALGTNIQAVPVSKLINNSNFIKVLERTVGGRVKTILINGQKFSGTEIRAKLGLKSTWFDWKINNGSITFITRGYGHGVGMCQYGANEFAKKGKKYDEILKHYYQGVEIKSIK